MVDLKHLKEAHNRCSIWPLPWINKRIWFQPRWQSHVIYCKCVIVPPLAPQSDSLPELMEINGDVSLYPLGLPVYIFWLLIVTCTITTFSDFPLSRRTRSCWLCGFPKLDPGSSWQSFHSNLYPYLRPAKTNNKVFHFLDSVFTFPRLEVKRLFMWMWAIFKNEQTILNSLQTAGISYSVSLWNL